jgi:hypothetical protein
MASVLDRPSGDTLAEAPTATEPETGIGLVQWVVAALLVGAGAVHFAMAPSHFGESAVEGWGFLIAGWLQVALAVAVVLRPSRRVATAVMAVSVASVAAWAVSRTVGLPFGAHAGHEEDVTIVDGLTVAMELAAIAAAGALLLPVAQRFRSRGVAFVAIAAALLFTSAAIASPEARDHAAGAHGGHVAGVAGAHGDPADMTSGDAATPAGHGHGTAADETTTDLNGHEIKGVKEQDVAAEHEPDVPLDPADRTLLSQQLVVARETAMKYPTTADAVAAGYRLVAGFGPGAGAHYIGGPMTGPGSFDPTQAQSLLYAGTDPGSPMVGLMYFGMGETAPEGFAGPNDHWHRHSAVCTTFGPNGIDVPFPPDQDVTREQCTSVGGNYMETTGWMVHAWVVPSWESPAGVFSHENPNLRCADGTFDTDDVGRCQGI